jgi:hypothetical protein
LFSSTITRLVRLAGSDLLAASNLRWLVVAFIVVGVIRHRHGCLVAVYIFTVPTFVGRCYTFELGRNYRRLLNAYKYYILDFMCAPGSVYLFIIYRLLLLLTHSVLLPAVCLS